MTKFVPDCLTKLQSEGINLEPLIGVMEYAWNYQKSKEVLNCLANLKCVILGIDVVSINEGECADTNIWSCHYENQKGEEENIKISHLKANESIESFHKKWGEHYLYMITYHHLKPLNVVEKEFNDKGLVFELAKVYRLNDTLKLIDRAEEKGLRIDYINIYFLSDGIENIFKGRNIGERVDLNKDYEILQSAYRVNGIWAVAKQFIKNQQERSYIDLGFEIIFAD